MSDLNRAEAGGRSTIETRKKEGLSVASWGWLKAGREVLSWKFLMTFGSWRPLR